MLQFVGNSVVSAADVVLFGPLRLWAERGLIHMEDSRDNSYEVVSVRTALMRMKAISELLGNSTSRTKNSEDQFDKAFRERNQAMLDSMCEIVRKAQVQGMPSDASASRDLARRAKKSIVVPGFGSGM